MFGYNRRMRDQLALIDERTPALPPQPKPMRIFAAGTIVSYELDVKDYVAFARRVAGHSEGSSESLYFPAPAESIVAYLYALEADGKRMTTIQRRLAALRWRHDRDEIESPTSSPLVQGVWRIILDRNGGIQKERPLALIERDIVQLVRSIGTEPADLRDRALILFSFRGGLSVSELAAIQIEDIELGPDLMVIQLRQPRLFGRRRKPRQPESGTIRIHRAPNAETCALAAYRAWLGILGSPTSGALFRSFIWNGALGKDASLDRQRMHEIVDARMKAAGLVGRDGRPFTVESLRYAKIAQAGLEGAKSIAEVLADEGYTSSNNRAAEIYRSAQQRRDDRSIPVGI